MADRRLRVLASTLTRDVTGIEHSVIRLLPRLREQGVNMVMAAPSGGELEQVWNEMGLEFIPMPDGLRVGLRDASGVSQSPSALLSQIPRSVTWISRLLGHARRADVVHSNSLLSHLDCVVAGRLARTPVVLEIHDILDPGRGRSLLSAAVRGASASIAVSNAALQQLSNSAQGKTTVVPQAVDAVAFAPGPATVRAELTDAPDSALVAVIGRVDPVKGIDTLIEAVSQIRARGRDLHLVIVGRPSPGNEQYGENLRRKAAELAPGAIRFVGHRSDVASVLRSVDILCVPSVREPFGLIAIEAMSVGTPVVASRTDGFLDYVVDGENGLLSVPGDPADVAGRILSLLDGSQLRTRLVARARRSVMENHEVSVRADRLIDVYRRVVK
ncbi:glycosyltransferase family 4 protein [Rhodococcus sp. NPDC060176]|uniref:glycosyltransferase family 4 protein n=1 Tax=unclassified Rhodococcus (in: high G+C Gram-positive bacteria) TaxID=192944 RepID=UPI003656BF16